MAMRNVTADTLAAALRDLPQVEREVFLAMLGQDQSYAVIAVRLGITPEDAERAFAAALVRVADALDAPPPAKTVECFLRRVAAAARLARRRLRR